MAELISEIARTHLLWALTDGVGPIIFGRLLIQFGGAEKALGLSARELEAVKGIGRDTADGVARSRDAARQQAELEIQAAGEHGVRILCRADADYPPGLKRIPDPPIVLYVKGELRPTDAVAIAIVGTRRCTIYGSEQARRFGELLAGAGFTVVSGLARGIDAFAHHGAVDAGGRSIAVLGSGLIDVYPPENRALAEKLLENGAWVSELPMQAAVRAENFPSRNRLIAGLTLGTLIVEAPSRSGALITARLACEYNREVFAIPGRVQEPASQGTNALIRDGVAKLVTCLEDILDELGEVGLAIKQGGEVESRVGTACLSGSARTGVDGEETGTRGANHREPASIADTAGADAPADKSERAAAEPLSRPSLRLSPAESRVYEIIGYDPILQDAVIRAAEFPTGEVLAAFTSLELKGLIKRLPGQLVVRSGTA